MLAFVLLALSGCYGPSRTEINASCANEHLGTGNYMIANYFLGTPTRYAECGAQ
jgi:hypothetical protein